MDPSLQKIFGVEKLDDPALPGTRPRDIGKVIYILLPTGVDLSDSFDEVTGKVDPFIPKHGAALLEYFMVKTPDQEDFFSIYFHGDVEGWRQQIEFGAKQLGLKTAKVHEDKFIVNEGPTYLLSDCTVTLDGKPFSLPGD
jgi:hypothetical protein